MRCLGLVLCFAALLSGTGPARADVAEAIRDHILPGYSRFTAASTALAAMDSCDVTVLRPAWNEAFDAWIGVAHLRLGPIEEDGRVLAIDFWPDPKGIGNRQMAQLTEAADPQVLTPEGTAELSVAVRGLTGLEKLLYADTTPDGFRCDLVHALAQDLARMAQETEAGWQRGFAASLTNPGPGGRYLNATESRQALLTSLITGLAFNADQRVDRPLGTFDRPRPERAEARSSARAQRNIELSLRALRGFAASLVPDSPATDAAFVRALAAAEKTDPMRSDQAGDWLKLQILGQSIRAVRDAAMAEIAPALGAGVGFNAADGD